MGTLILFALSILGIIIFSFFNFCCCFSLHLQKTLLEMYVTQVRVKFIEIAKFYKKDKDQLTAGVLELSC